MKKRLTFWGILVSAIICVILSYTTASNGFEVVSDVEKVATVFKLWVFPALFLILGIIFPLLIEKYNLLIIGAFVNLITIICTLAGYVNALKYWGLFVNANGFVWVGYVLLMLTVVYAIVDAVLRRFYKMLPSWINYIIIGGSILVSFIIIISCWMVKVNYIVDVATGIGYEHLELEGLKTKAPGAVATGAILLCLSTTMVCFVALAYDFDVPAFLNVFKKKVNVDTKNAAKEAANKVAHSDTAHSGYIQQIGLNPKLAKDRKAFYDMLASDKPNVVEGANANIESKMEEIREEKIEDAKKAQAGNKEETKVASKKKATKKAPKKEEKNKEENK